MQAASDARDPGEPRSGVRRIRRCELTSVPQPWPFAVANAAAIEVNWERGLAANPAMFNGVVLHVRELRIDPAEGGTLRAILLPVEFKAHLYWRQLGFPEAGVRDGFGSALIRAADGAYVLGRQREGVNRGLTYLPGGFIDPRDVDENGAVDIDGSIARELTEETGLVATDLEAVPGYMLTFAGPLLSIAREFRSRLPADEVRGLILDFIADDPNAELLDAVVVRRPSDLTGLAMPDYARVLLTWLLDQDR